MSFSLPDIAQRSLTENTKAWWKNDAPTHADLSESRDNSEARELPVLVSCSSVGLQAIAHNSYKSLLARKEPYWEMWCTTVPHLPITIYLLDNTDEAQRKVTVFPLEPTRDSFGADCLDVIISHEDLHHVDVHLPLPSRPEREKWNSLARMIHRITTESNELQRITLHIGKVLTIDAYRKSSSFRARELCQFDLFCLQKRIPASKSHA